MQIKIMIISRHFQPRSEEIRTGRGCLEIGHQHQCQNCHKKGYINEHRPKILNCMDLSEETT